MEFPSENANSQDITDVSSKNLDEHKSPSPNPSQPNSEETSHGNKRHRSPEPLEEKEFACKYCDNKFSNKQALGGHQNAHKLERARENNILDPGHENGFGYFGGNPSYHGMNSTLYSGSFYGSVDLTGGALIDRSYTSQHPMNHGVHVGYYGLPGQPMVGEPYGSHLVPGFNHAYSGWAPSTSRTPQFTPSYMQNQGLDPPIPIIDSGSSSARPVSGGPSTTDLSKFRLDGNLGGENPELDESNLDLSLKL